jgi:cysteine desulfurase
MKEIYLDNASTTKTDEEVIKTIKKYYADDYGNPSSIHYKGQKARESVEKSRKIIAESINADADEIFFTSGGTESNNLALKGIFFASNKDKKHIITTSIEHKSVIESCGWLKEEGAVISYIDVDSEGFLDSEKLKKEINENTILVSVIHGNNEIGTIQDIEKIGEICKEKGVYFHIDACQSYLKKEINVKKMNIDLISMNSHKIHGPKGVGALYIKKNTKIKPLFHGGHQESGLRSGTENVAGIVGFAKAVEIWKKSDIEKMKELNKLLIDSVLKIEGSVLNGTKNTEKRLCNNTHFSFKRVEGESILGLLNEEGIFISTGSACSERNIEQNYVLKAIGLNHEYSNGSIRVTISKFTTKEEIETLVKKLSEVISKLRSISPI